MKRVAILGSSGSIGVTTLKVIKQYPGEFKLEALAVNKNIESLKRQAAEFKPGKIAVGDEEAGKKINKIGGRDIYYGIEGLNRIASDRDVDIVVIGLSGSAALHPLLSAIRAGKHIALANKEALVMAGSIIMGELKKSKARLIPVDSEQSAIFQCLEGKEQDELKRLYLTASGGALYDVALKDFKYLNKKDILNHPRWKMGQKITVDSATLMNKGLEVIEASWLFDVEVRNIEVLIHRQAIIHSMVEFVDGSVLAQLGVTDMSLPIQYALTYPRRLSNPKNHLDFFSIESLTFARSLLEVGEGLFGRGFWVMHSSVTEVDTQLKLGSGRVRLDNGLQFTTRYLDTDPEEYIKPLISNIILPRDYEPLTFSVHLPLATPSI